MRSFQSIARRIRVPMGFVFAAFFLWFARPTLESLLWSLLLVVPGLALRGYASAYIKKNAELTRTGPYAYTRNPLYLGSILIAFGFGVASRNWILVIALTALFLLIYLPTIRSEEEFLRTTFPQFDAYAARVPRLLPRIVPAKFEDATRGGFSMGLYRKHREYNAAMGAAAIYAALLVRWWISIR
jgi:protein-S-isoprenylcysteine O-methyltransferase Ste14